MYSGNAAAHFGTFLVRRERAQRFLKTLSPSAGDCVCAFWAPDFACLTHTTRANGAIVTDWAEREKLCLIILTIWEAGQGQREETANRADSRQV